MSPLETGAWPQESSLSGCTVRPSAHLRCFSAQKSSESRRCSPCHHTQPNPLAVTKLPHQVPGFGAVPLQLQESKVFSKVILTDTELMPINPKAVLSTSGRLHQYPVSHQAKQIPCACQSKWDKGAASSFTTPYAQVFLFFPNKTNRARIHKGNFKSHGHKYSPFT